MLALSAALVLVDNGVRRQPVPRQQLVERAAKKAATAEVREQLGPEVKAEVADQLDERLPPTTTVPTPPPRSPSTTAPPRTMMTTTTTTTAFDLTTTTSITLPEITIPPIG